MTWDVSRWITSGLVVAYDVGSFCSRLLRAIVFSTVLIKLFVHLLEMNLFA